MSDLYQLTRLNADLIRENEKLKAERDALKAAINEMAFVVTKSGDATFYGKVHFGSLPKGEQTDE